MSDDRAVNFYRSLQLDPRQMNRLLEDLGSECGGILHYSKICWIREKRVFCRYYNRQKYPLEKESHSAAVKV
jgi:hypothetical protein